MSDCNFILSEFYEKALWFKLKNYFTSIFSNVVL